MELVLLCFDEFMIESLSLSLTFEILFRVELIVNYNDILRITINDTNKVMKDFLSRTYT